ncbi:MAG: metallophosphoesterase, partial [Alphaproteobacteria bacterium]|nr:metallophosphoesterase [Alphaproteobacteria bacterium]
MTMWIIIFWVSIAFAITTLFYVSARIPNLLEFTNIAEWGKFKQFSLGLLITLGFTGIIALCIDFINATLCVMYVAMIWAVSDFAFWLIEKLRHITFEHYPAGWIALVISAIALSVGWYLDHNVWQTGYELKTNKQMSDLKVAMFADSHIGTTFDDKGFAKHLKIIQAQNPDIVFIAGDYVDDGTTREQMINATRTLGQMKTKYGIYYVSGNHDKGYYGAAHRGFSEYDFFNELQKNGINIVQDESILIDNSFYIIGRRDYSVRHEQG